MTRLSRTTGDGESMTKPNKIIRIIDTKTQYGMWITLNPGETHQLGKLRLMKKWGTALKQLLKKRLLPVGEVQYIFHKADDIYPISTVGIKQRFDRWY